jgi:adapter protein MecA 1/2
MKIEKINDNQIRCTLTREELAERQMKLSELAYGTEKARMLFRDMMQQAEYEYGFEAEDIPLMIEAVPMSTDSIVLVITKVEYPDELDTRFSKFSPPDPEDLMGDLAQSGEAGQKPQGADDILGLFKRLQEEYAKAVEAVGQDTAGATDKKGAKDVVVSAPVDITKMYMFNDISDIIRIARVLDGFYSGHNDLYRDPGSRRYFLTVSKSDMSPENFNKVCNIISEYAPSRNYTPATGAYFTEHYRPVIRANALETLSQL